MTTTTIQKLDKVIEKIFSLFKKDSLTDKQCMYCSLIVLKIIFYEISKNKEDSKSLEEIKNLEKKIRKIIN